jgi:hypothetical protein
MLDVQTMRVHAKASLYSIVSTIALLVVEVSIFWAAEYFDFIALLYIFGPIALLIAMLYWIHKITGIRCANCNNLYGVSIGQRGWPDVPSNCLYCGAEDITK